MSFLTGISDFLHNIFGGGASNAPVSNPIQQAFTQQAPVKTPVLTKNTQFAYNDKTGGLDPVVDPVQAAVNTTGKVSGYQYNSDTGGLDPIVGSQKSTDNTVLNQYDNGALWDAPSDNYNESGKMIYDPTTYKYVYHPYNADDKTHQDINYQTNNIENDGGTAPAPQVNNPYERSPLEKIFDPVASLGFGIRKAIQDVIKENPDENPLTGFIKGTEAGWQDTKEAKANRVSTSDLLDAMGWKNQDNPTGVWNNPTTWNGNNVLRNIAGFAGDVATDPTSYLAGIGEAGKVLSTGAKAFDAEKALGNGAVGGLEHATEIASNLKSADPVAEGQRLFNKTQSALGYVDPAYKGITLAGIPIVPKGLLSAIGDSPLSAPFKAIDNGVNAIKDSKFGAALAGTKNYELVQQARKDPANAIGYIAQKESLKLRMNQLFAGEQKIKENTQKIQNETNGGKDNVDVANANEMFNKQNANTTYTYETLDKSNPEYQVQSRNFWQGEIDKVKAQLADEQDKIKEMQQNGAPSSDIVDKINDTVKMSQQMKEMDSLDKLSSTNFAQNLEQSGMISAKIPGGLKNTILADPVEWQKRNFAQAEAFIKGHVPDVTDEEAGIMAAAIKHTADTTMNQIGIKAPDMWKYMTGVERTSVDGEIKPTEMFHNPKGGTQQAVMDYTPDQWDSLMSNLDPEVNKTNENMFKVDVPDMTQKYNDYSNVVSKANKLIDDNMSIMRSKAAYGHDVSENTARIEQLKQIKSKYESYLDDIKNSNTAEVNPSVQNATKSYQTGDFNPGSKDFWKSAGQVEPKTGNPLYDILPESKGSIKTVIPDKSNNGMVPVEKTVQDKYASLGSTPEEIKMNEDALGKIKDIRDKLDLPTDDNTMHMFKTMAGEKSEYNIKDGVKTEGTTSDILNQELQHFEQKLAKRQKLSTENLQVDVPEGIHAAGTKVPIDDHLNWLFKQLGMKNTATKAGIVDKEGQVITDGIKDGKNVSSDGGSKYVYMKSLESKLYSKTKDARFAPAVEKNYGIAQEQIDKQTQKFIDYDLKRGAITPEQAKVEREMRNEQSLEYLIKEKQKLLAKQGTHTEINPAQINNKNIYGTPSEGFGVYKQIKDAYKNDPLLSTMSDAETRDAIDRMPLKDITPSKGGESHNFYDYLSNKRDRQYSSRAEQIDWNKSEKGKDVSDPNALESKRTDYNKLTYDRNNDIKGTNTNVEDINDKIVTNTKNVIMDTKDAVARKTMELKQALKDAGANRDFNAGRDVLAGTEDHVLDSMLEKQIYDSGLSAVDTDPATMSRNQVIDKILEYNKNLSESRDMLKPASSKQLANLDKQLSYIKDKNPEEYAKIQGDIKNFSENINKGSVKTQDTAAKLRAKGFDSTQADYVASKDFKITQQDYNDFYARIQDAKISGMKKNVIEGADKAKSLKTLDTKINIMKQYGVDPKVIDTFEKWSKGASLKESKISEWQLSQTLKNAQNRIDGFLSLSKEDASKVPIESSNLSKLYTKYNALKGTASPMDKIVIDKEISRLNSLQKAGKDISGEDYRNMLYDANKMSLKYKPDNYFLKKENDLIDQGRTTELKKIDANGEHPLQPSDNGYSDSYVFKTPNGHVKVSTDADMEKVQALHNEYIKNDKNLTKNATLNIHTDNGGVNYTDKNGNIHVGVDTAPQTVSHEVQHITGMNAPQKVAAVDSAYRSELNSKTPEEKAQIKAALEQSGVKVSDENFNKGFASDYAKQSADANPKNEYVRTQEHYAEIAPAFFHEDAGIKMQALMPDTYRNIKDVLHDMPISKIKAVIPKTTPAREELLNTMERYNKMLDIAGYKNVSGSAMKIAELKAKLADMSAFDQKTMDEKLERYCETNFNGKTFSQLSGVPGFKEMEHIISKTTTEDIIKQYPEHVQALVKWMQEEFGKMASSEDIQTIANYLPHIINPELAKLDKAKAVEIMSERGFNMKDPFNIFALHRTMDEPISVINKRMEEQYGIKDFFDTNVARLYCKRGIANQKLLYEKQNLHDMLTVGAHKIAHKDEYKDLSKPEQIKFFNQKIHELGLSPVKEGTGIEGQITAADVKKAYFDEISKRFNDSNMVYTKLNPRYEETQIKTVSDKTIEDGVHKRNLARESQREVQAMTDSERAQRILQFEIDQPMIHVPLKDVTDKKMYEKLDDGSYIMPRGFYDTYKSAMENQFKEDRGGFVKAFTKITRIFKANATSVNPSFHVNNAIGNALNSWLECGIGILRPKTQTEALKAGVAVGGKLGQETKMWNGMTGSEFHNILKEYGIVENTIFNESDRAFLKGDIANMGGSTNPIKKILQGLNPADTQHFAPYKVGQFVGSNIENNAKIANFIYHLQNGKSYAEAADLTHKVMFDYNDVSDFEDRVMKNIVPFYTWMRKNVPLQVNMLIDKPYKYNIMMSAKRNMSQPESDTQKELKPDYLSDAIPTGNGTYINPNLPINDLTKMMSPKDLFSSLNPMMKLAVELPTNKNVYYNSPIKATQYSKTDATGLLKLIADKNNQVDPNIPYVLQNLIPSTTKASYFATGNTAKEQQWMSGFKSYSPDFAALSDSAKKDYIQQLTEYSNYLYSLQKKQAAAQQ